MQIATGMKRVSLVWWCFVGLCVVGVGIALMTDPGGFRNGLICVIVGVGAATALHNLTCWIIDGFSKPSAK